MVHYDVRLHTDRGVKISNKEIECTPENIPDVLTSIVLDYLRDTPYPGVIKARVTDGDRYAEYMLLLENDTLHVYLHALQADRAEVQEQSQHPDGSKELPDREESA